MRTGWLIAKSAVDFNYVIKREPFLNSYLPYTLIIKVQLNFLDKSSSKENWFLAFIVHSVKA